MKFNSLHGAEPSEDLCFFEDNLEGFYDNPAPSIDIWKKFELLPTPPRSPSRDSGSALSPIAEDTLQLVSEYINEDDPLCETNVISDLISDVFDDLDCPDTLSLGSFDTNNSDILISDCMWSVSVKEELTKSVSSTNVVTTSTSSGTAPSVDIECVDPTAVFPYPSVPEQTSANGAPNTNASRQSSGVTHMAREHSYSSLGTDTPSDSEEEIDVVTVDKDKYTVCTKRKASSNTSLPNTTVLTLQPQSKHLYINKSTNLSQVALSLKRPIRSISTPNSPQTSHHPSKRLKRESSVPNGLKSVAKHRTHHRTTHTTSDGDSEDSDGKRTQHNVLERKRRNDLKYSFLTLRDHVPELHAQERAPKVTILKMAAEHIRALTREEKTLASEVERQRTRREQLQRRLEALRRSLAC